MATSTKVDTVMKVYQVFIKATPDAIWAAITDPEWTQRYGYQGRSEYDLRAGGSFRNVADEQQQAAGMPAVVVDGTVIEANPPHRLVQTWRFLWSEDVKAEGPTTLTYEIEDAGNGVSKLTVTHELENAPVTTAQISGEIPNAGGGWAYVLSDLKTLLETGSCLTV